MSQGRGNACTTFLLIGPLIFVILQTELVQAATFTVGDAGGWTFNVINWPNGKRFRAGDVLAFNYDPAFHNLVVVDKAGYDCKTPGKAKVYTSGKDRITLGKGQSFFVCSIPGHCDAGMRIAVNAA